MEEEDNNEVDNTNIENNEDENVMRKTNNGISAAEENDLCEEAMQSEKRDQYGESEERNQSM